MHVLVAFLAADSELLESHWLNNAAAWLSFAENPMIHSEILFVDHTTAKDVIGKACSIHYGGEVFLQNKKFSRTQWRFRTVNCTEEQAQKALKFCKSKVGQKFNKLGYFLQPICSPKRMAEDRWFCSEIVAGALREAGVDVEMSLHPNQLYESIKDITTPDCPRVIKDMHF